MKLLSLQDFQYSKDGYVFKESSINLIIYAILMGATSFGLCLLSGIGMPLFMVIVSSGGVGLFAFIYFYLFVKSFSHLNWVLRLNSDKIIIKCRSHLNQYLPKTDKQIVEFGLDEIKDVRVVKEKIKTEGSSGIARGTKIIFTTYLEISLVSSDLRELKKMLNYELNVKTKRTKHHDYHVSVYNENKIRIEWKSAKTTLTPRIKRALKMFSKQSVKVEFGEYEKKDYKKTLNIDKEEMETRILDLAQKGNKIDAIKLIRKTYNYDITEAKLFMESLLNE